MSADLLHHNHEALKESEWTKVSELMRPIWELSFGKGSNSEIAAQALLFRNSITMRRKLLCIDEGTVDGLHLAGQGILGDFNEVIGIIRGAGIDGVYSHAGCGAAAMHAAKVGIAPERADEHGIDFTKKLAVAANIPYEGHITAGEMKRPDGLHNAAVAYYTALSINTFGVEGLPNGFVINHAIHMVPTHARDEAKLATQIALGAHGFGERFTTEHPFVIAVIGNGQDLMQSADMLAINLIGLDTDFAGRVRIDKINI